MASRMRNGSDPSVKDVASLAGVSVGTVSNVLNYPDRVSTSLVKRVNKSINQLGYVRNEAARQLRVGQSKTIGFLVPNLHDPFHEELFRGVDDAATAHGLSVLVGSLGGNPSREWNLLSLFQKYRLAGVIIASKGLEPLAVRALVNASMNVVALNVDGKGSGVPSVGVDNGAVGTMAAEHVVAQGAKKVAILSGIPDERPDFRLREHGALALLARHREVAVEILRLGELSVEAGREIGHSLLARPRENRPDAIISTHDLWALGALHSVLATPETTSSEDILIIGCGDIDTYRISPVGLSSIRVPAYEMGVAALEEIIEVSENENRPIRHTKIAPSLVVRASSSSPLPSGIVR